MKFSPEKTKMEILYIVLFLTSMFFMACAAQVEEKQEKSESESQVPSPPPPNQSLDPGTARIEATLLNFSEMDHYYECNVKVEKVLNYGRSTKPIARGNELKLQVSKDQGNFVNIFSEGTLQQKFEFTVVQEEIINLSSKHIIWKAVHISGVQLNQ